MNLRDLLEELRENVLRDTSDAAASDHDSFLISDKSLVRYLNEAQERFAEQTQCLRDETTPEITRIPVEPGVESYPLDPRVCEVLDVRLNETRLRLRPYGTFAYRQMPYPDDEPFDTSQVTGAPLCFYTDREAGRLGIYPAPGKDYSKEPLDPDYFVLRVARMPIKRLVVEDLEAVPEIPAQFHMALVDWAAYRAFTNDDTELFDLTKANGRKARFNEAVAELNRKSKRQLLNQIAFRRTGGWS